MEGIQFSPLSRVDSIPQWGRQVSVRQMYIPGKHFFEHELIASNEANICRNSAREVRRNFLTKSAVKEENESQM